MIHRTQLSIRTFHTDAFGHVNNSRYLELLEEARWRYAEDVGLTELMQPAGLGFIIIDLKLRFRQPVRVGDRVTIATSLNTLGTASGEVHQTLAREDASSPAVKGVFHFILIDRQSEKSVPIEGAIRNRLLDVLEPSKSASRTAPPASSS